jgi:hypothetical protein
MKCGKAHVCREKCDANNFANRPMQRETCHRILFAAVASILTIIYSVYFFQDQARWYRLWYYTPAAATAGAVFFSRIRERRRGWRAWLIDLTIVVICLLRPLTGEPPVSGHALFSIYALLTTHDRISRMLSVVLLAVTCYAKIVLWHGDETLWSGLLLGFLAGMICRRVIANFLVK